MALLSVLRRRKEARAEIDRLILNATEVYVTAAITDDTKPLPPSVLEFLEAGLPGPQEYPAYDSLHRAVTGSVQGLLALSRCELCTELQPPSAMSQARNNFPK
jgi:hypothetical protein